MTGETARGRALPSPSARPGTADQQPTVPYPAHVPEPLTGAVAAEVRRLLDERGISGRQLAQLTGIPSRTVANKLSDRSPFDLDDLVKVCRVLEVDVTDLLSWAQKH